MRHYLPNGSYVEVLRTTMGREMENLPLVEGEWNVVDEENATTTGVKIPVISMEDVPKLAKEMQK